MHKTISTFFILFISLSVFAKSGKVILSGKVSNPSVTSIKITYFDYKEVASAELDDNGNFKISAKIEGGFYFLSYGRNTAYIYLYPKDELSISFDAEHFDETLVFEGKGAERNNYLAKKSVKGSELTKDLDAFYKVDETTYIKNIANVKQRHLNALAKINVEDFFKTAEEKSLEFERLLSIQNYKSNYKFYLGEEISPSKGFYKPVEKIDVRNEDDYKRQPYYRYLVNSVWNKKIDAAPDAESMLNVLREVKSQPIIISLINGFYSKISSNKERAKDYLDLIKMVTTHQPFIEAAEKQYQEVMKSKGLSKGDASPEFSYETIDGKIISLNDLKGKYVYIDVWATWCAPCIKQVPYLKQLEERYHNKNIVFVSISVDKEKVKDTWKQMIADKELGGLQLFADKSFDSDFMNAYAVNSIPRFILIDPEGKIVDPEAPRPSFDKTRVLLDELLH
ncbi:TlpA disulfide reductase family protein [uncultured Winogradskyella sp.]|uniref:TlpA family protein disulfide reductase n=1 Tax=uncultured Winogradskyella sp. TaxID=395353 RepID=UPI0026306C0E|nr:TlpA disulfide reductase family protein [uncultured Winogradskyella sp.]